MMQLIQLRDNAGPLRKLTPRFHTIQGRLHTALLAIMDHYHEHVGGVRGRTALPTQEQPVAALLDTVAVL